MNKRLVYDLPMRVFHGIFAARFIVAFLIAKTVDDESAAFSYQMLAGFLLVFTVSLRIIWGFVGSKYSRFSSFALQPKDLVSYFSGMLSGEKRKWAGHNPASSWASLAMFGCAIGLGVTGYLMASGQKETFEDLHELFANGFLVVVLMHVAGIILHSLRHRDGIALSMLHGEKGEVGEGDGIVSRRVGVAVLFIGLVISFALYLTRHFDAQKQTLNLFGNTLQLGENEGNESGEKESTQGGDKYQEGEKDDD